MKQVCVLCERQDPSGNLYCQEIYCPAEKSPTVLDYGEWLGDIEIVKPIIILRSSVLYKAKHQKQTVYLKVAHPGEENKNRLKREAEFLSKTQDGISKSSFLPTLLPPYVNATIREMPYGKIVFQGHLLYFSIFEFFEGEPLRDTITQNPQLWINHVGWLLISLSSAIAFVQQNGLFHYGISPDIVLVRFDEEPSAPRILLFDLGIASKQSEVLTHWNPSLALPAYTAPELLQAGTIRPSYQVDVYGLGITLYELLVGEPPYSYKLQSDEEICKAVLDASRIRMNRAEDVPRIAAIAQRAVQEKSALRFENAIEMMQQLIAYFGPVPERVPTRFEKMTQFFRRSSKK